MSDEQLRSLRCDDCAFSAGTEANSCSVTRLKAKLCVDAPVPFYCHRREGLCAGWAVAVTTKEASGFYEHLAPWKPAVMNKCLDVIAINEEKDTKGEPITDRSVIQDIINVMGIERPDFLKESADVG